ncbi:MAG: M48 family metallopeptidase [Bacteroidales bacterium]|nr:M48 family metallopeptidase [Bacteroidales bacterium]
MKKNNFIYIVTIAFMVIACYKVPLTNRYQIRLLPDVFVTTLSLEAYEEFIKENKVVPTSDIRHQRVQNVGIKLVNAANEIFGKTKYAFRIKDFSWDFKVVEKNTANAFCLPGGKIVFFSGILPIAQDDDGIAVVMGHEIAHAIARHGNERLSQQLLIVLGETSLEIAMKNKPKETREIFKSLYGISSTLGALAYSRKHEYEADKIGLIIMAKAGYNPQKAIEFWERMKNQSKGNIMPEWLSTHPSDENRIKALKKFLPEAMKYYKP